MRCAATDERCDQYSFGVVVWEMLAQAVPWAGLSGLQACERGGACGTVWDRVACSQNARVHPSPQVMFAVAVERRRPALPPGAPPALASLVAALWDDDPSRRPPFLDVRVALARLRADHAGLGGAR